MTFQWRWDQALEAGETFDVRVCKGEGCRPQFGKTNVGESTWQWLPDQGSGTYRWQVVVIRKEGDRVVAEIAFSSVRQFVWTGDGDDSSPYPGPTNTPAAQTDSSWPLDRRRSPDRGEAGLRHISGRRAVG